jgi:precorrin-3B synthase
MRDLTATVAISDLARAAGFPQIAASRLRARRQEFMGACSFDATSERPTEGRAFVGIGLPFGRISADGLNALAEAAEARGATEFRLTPWRAILIPLPSMAVAQALSVKAASMGLIVDAGDPRRRLAACVGAPSCAMATTNVRADALRLMALAADAPGKDVALHVSGCAKGCAHPGPTRFTLVGRDGRYDALRDGSPMDAPLRRGLGLLEAAEFLRTARRSRAEAASSTGGVCAD